MEGKTNTRPASVVTKNPGIIIMISHGSKRYLDCERFCDKASFENSHNKGRAPINYLTPTSSTTNIEGASLDEKPSHSSSQLVLDSQFPSASQYLNEARREDYLLYFKKRLVMHTIRKAGIQNRSLRSSRTILLPSQFQHSDKARGFKRSRKARDSSPSLPGSFRPKERDSLGHTGEENGDLTSYQAGCETAKEFDVEEKSVLLDGQTTQKNDIQTNKVSIACHGHSSESCVSSCFNSSKLVSRLLKRSARGGRRSSQCNACASATEESSTSRGFLFGDNEEASWTTPPSKRTTGASKRSVLQHERGNVIDSTRSTKQQLWQFDTRGFLGTARRRNRRQWLTRHRSIKMPSDGRSMEMVFFERQSS